jgi:L-lactate utilization protein LutC
MKRIALIAVVLGLGASPALAAAANTQSPASAAPPAQQQPMPGKAQHHAAMHAANYRENQREDRETKALNLLEAKGDTQFSHFKADGLDFSAVVAKNGQNSTVVVDPDNGQVTVQG